VRGFGGGYDYRWWSWLLSPLTGWIVLLFFLAFAVRKSQANGESQ